MNIRQNIKDLKDDLLLNRNVGTFSWMLHRITGLVLAFYIFLHLIVLGSEFLFGQGSFSILMGKFEIPVFKLLELCLVWVIVFHGVNGLRIIIADFLMLTRLHKVFFWVGMFLLGAVMILAVIVFFHSIGKYKNATTDFTDYTDNL